jgi:hypothetical protein
VVFVRKKCVVHHCCLYLHLSDDVPRLECCNAGSTTHVEARVDENGGSREETEINGHLVEKSPRQKNQEHGQYGTLEFGTTADPNWVQGC